MTKLEKELKQFDYNLILPPDIHGIFRTKIYRSKDSKNFNKPIPVPCDLSILGVNNEIIVEAKCSEYRFGNIGFKADPSRIVALPWLDGNTGKTHCGVLGSIFWNDGKPAFDCRYLALQQVKELASHGYEIMSSGEYEFRMFKDPKAPEGYTENVLELQPGHTLGFGLSMIYHRYRDFLVDVFDSLTKAGVGTDYVIPEYGSGQLEIPLNPRFGIDGPDNSAIFKNAMHHLALNHGYRVTFMAKPILGETGNGCHFNHSIWKTNEDGSRTNALYDKDNGDNNNLSKFAMQWIAGIMEHSAALAAFCSPTVNCYRRLHSPWAPHEIFWGVENRRSLLRVKVDGEEATYFENRLGSSAANPYLLFAATIAAGLDGVKRNLTPPANHEKKLDLLPSTLGEALEALKKDDVIVKALGKEFVDAYVQVKTDSELKLLADIDISVDDPKALELEKKEYFDQA